MSPSAEITPRFANAPELRALAVGDVLAMGACYDEARIRELAARLPEKATALEVGMALRGVVPDADMIWLLLRPAWYVRPMPVLVTLAADFAAGVLGLYEAAYPGDMRPRQAIEAARAVANGTGTAEAAAAAAAAVWAAAAAAAAARAAAAAAAAARAARVAVWAARAARVAVWAERAEAAKLDRILSVIGGGA